MSDFRFTVDESFAKKNNEMLKDSRRLQSSALVFGLVLIAAAVAVVMFTSGAPWAWMLAVAAGVMALICFIMIPVIPRQIGSAQKLYDTYKLVPAIVVEVNPRDVVLLALVNVNADPTRPPQWGLATRTITNLVGHPHKLGTKVPAVAVTGRRSVADQDHWHEITPMPIAWATPDKDIVNEARKAIPQQQWHELERNRDRLDEVKETKFNLLVL